MVTKTPETLPETLTAMQLAQIIQALEQLGFIVGPANTSGGSTTTNSLGDSDHVFTSQGGNIGPPGGGGGAPGAGCVAAATAYHHVHTAKKESTPTTPSKSSNTEICSVQGTPLRGSQRSPTPGTMYSPRIRRSTATWYTVTVGYEVGVFQGWDVVAPLVLHVSGPIYLHHLSRAAAQAHYNNALERGDVEIVLRDNSDDE
ncbi:hypothetical protein EDD18DRAFT_1344300 [Armillaria luteobubalina]|uniref:Ribonuclease H1 N-terminal domain-containing protein n=1 Tax=Armillaria luteobubalina TaxID=153913 RepID=A0AA39QP31_9AGAR|nr:hypothetical protein EDD18DRAFT_1344300 [Armillaria luteobubalina]